MSREIKGTEELLLLRLGRMVKENVELEQRVHQLTDDFNEVVRQLQGREKRKDEDPARQTLGQMSQMRDLCDSLKFENKQLRIYAMAFDECMKDQGLYIPKGVSCPYLQDHPIVASTSCLECDSCLRALDGCGVVCRQVLNGAKVGSVNPCPPHTSKS